jgi:hypothetical protein
MEEKKTVNLNQLPMLRLQRDIDALFAARKTLARAGRDTATLFSLSSFFSMLRKNSYEEQMSETSSSAGCARRYAQAMK